MCGGRYSGRGSREDGQWWGVSVVVLVGGGGGRSIIIRVRPTRRLLDLQLMFTCDMFHLPVLASAFLTRRGQGKTKKPHPLLRSP